MIRFRFDEMENRSEGLSGPHFARNVRCGLRFSELNCRSNDGGDGGGSCGCGKKRGGRRR